MDVRAAAWSAQHHGIDVSAVPLLRGWLWLMAWCATPLARWRVPPTAVTVLGVLCALGAVGSRPWVALVLVVVASWCDGLDGAVARISSRSSRSGAIADAWADRIADCAFAAVIWRCGAPWWLAALAAALSLAQEGIRGRRRGPLLVKITVAERPTRAICTLLACGCAAMSAASWPAVVCAAVWIGLTVIALGQLVRAGGRVR